MFRTAAILIVILILHSISGRAAFGQAQRATIPFTTSGGNLVMLAPNADDDEDGVENLLEIDGYAYTPSTGLQACTPAGNPACFQTDPTQWSTDGDPYSDYMEVTGVNMPAGVQRPFNHPLVAARPVIAMRMPNYQVSPLGDITNSQGGDRQKSFTNTTTNTDQLGGSLSTTVEAKLNPFEPVSASATATIEYSHTWTRTESSTSTLGSNWSSARSTNINEAAALTLQVYMENLGSADALDVQPTFNLMLDNTVIATIQVSEDDRANVLSTNGTPNSRYPRSGTIAIDRDSRGNPITVSIEELKAIQSGAALALVVTQVSADVIRWDKSTQNWDSEIAWTSFENQIDPVTMTVQADLGDGEIHEYEIYAGSAYNEPDYTLRDVLARVFSVEERDGETYIEGRKYPGEWYFSTPSEAIVADWEAAGRPASMIDVHMRPTTRLILQSTASTQGPHIGLATFSSDMRHVFVSAQPHVYPIFEATATVSVNGRLRQVQLVRRDGFPFLTNEVPLEAPASPEAVVRVVDAVDNVSTASIVPGALRRDCEDVLAELEEDEFLQYGRRYLVFDDGDPDLPIDVYCNNHGEVETLHFYTPGQISPRAFYNAHFINDSTGVVVGQNGWLSVTETALFTSFLKENHGIPGSIHDAHMVSPDTIRAIGAGGVFAWTYDGGETWQSHTAGGSEVMFGMDFLDDDFGVASGGSGVISVTRDGGLTWERRDSNTGFTLFDVDVVSDTMAVAVGASGRVTISRDGGQTWRSQVPPPINSYHPQLNSVSFLNDSTGLAVGDQGTIIKTEDGGTVWTRISSTTGQNLWRVQYISSQIAMAVGMGGTVLRSHDGGDSWQAIAGGINVYTGTNYIGMHFLDENHGFIVGHEGRGVATGSGFGHPVPLFAVGTEDEPKTDAHRELPAQVELSQNYPNPFNPTTTIAFFLAEQASVRLTVFDLLGRQVRVLVDGPLSPGAHQVPFDAGELASGTYLYRLQAGNLVQTRKMVLVR